MHSIKLRKVEGGHYTPKGYKTYEAYKGGQHVGYVTQDFRYRWEVTDPYMVPVSRHTTIKAAARVAGRVL